jgi:peptide/nickel transport system ATP-binding protein
MHSSEIKPILEVKNLTTKLQLGGKAFTVVDDISFNLFKGKTLAVVGESGCGKSMMALSLMRILPTPPALPSQGQILYEEDNLLDISEKKMRTVRGARIAMIFQDPTTALNPVYTIGNQLLEVSELHLGIYGDEAVALAVQALTDVGIDNPQERLYDYPHQLSGGMRQRVMIAMALICKPDVLIADEPTTALDVTIQAQVLELIRNLQKKEGMALLLITHDMGVVAKMADEVMVMYASQSVEKGSVYQLFDQMSHPYTAGLFQSRPNANMPRGSRLEAIKGSVPPLTQYPEGCRFHPRCPYAMEKCRRGEVPLFSGRGNDGHTSKCWLWDGTPESRGKIKERPLP